MKNIFRKSSEKYFSRPKIFEKKIYEKVNEKWKFQNFDFFGIFSKFWNFQFVIDFFEDFFSIFYIDFFFSRDLKFLKSIFVMKI